MKKTILLSVMLLTTTTQAGVVSTFIKMLSNSNKTTVVTKSGLIITTKNGVKTVRKPSVKNTGGFAFNATGIAAMRSKNVKEAFTISKHSPKGRILANTADVSKAGKKFTEAEKAALVKREKEIYSILKKQEKARKLANKTKPKKAKKK